MQNRKEPLSRSNLKSQSAKHSENLRSLKETLKDLQSGSLLNMKGFMKLTKTRVLNHQRSFTLSSSTDR